MILMFEKGIWGRITQPVKRYARANNKYMKNQYNPDEKTTYFQYLDKNNFTLLFLDKRDDFTTKMNNFTII